MKNESGVIYRATCIPTGKSYIGQTIDFKRRKSQHERGNSSAHSHFFRAMRKYGKGSFQWDIICDTEDAEMLDALEICYIHVIGTVSPSGYNLQDGGECGRHSEETRKKISEAIKGKKRSVETRKKMSDNNVRYWKGKSTPIRGKHHTLEARKKMSEKAKGRVPWNKGKKASAEARANMSAAKKGKPSGREGKRWHKKSSPLQIRFL